MNLANNEIPSFSASLPERNFKSSLLLDSLATIKDVLENRTTYPPVESIEICDKEVKDIIFKDEQLKHLLQKIDPHCNIIKKIQLVKCGGHYQLTYGKTHTASKFEHTP